MPKPLQSQDPNPKSTQFAHFGVLDTGKSSKTAAVTSIVLNVSVAALIIILGYVIKSNPKLAKQITQLTLPPEPVKPPPPPPKPPPPPPPKLVPPKLEPPKIKPPDPVPLPPDVKPIEVPVPKPVVIAPAPPKAVTPPPAPKVVNLAMAAPASVPNHDAVSTPVKLGSTTNPLKSLTGPAASPVNLGSNGVPGMPKSNSGNGVAGAKSVNLGSGSPSSNNMNGGDNASRTVVGVKLGVPGGTGPLNSKNYAQQPVNLQAQVVAPLKPPPVIAKPSVKSPVVTYKPEPAYTSEAKSMHLEGNVSVRIRVSANGTVQVLGVVHGLGHGLDESAVQAAQATRFKPAIDSDGHAIDWEGVVLVTFQMS